MTYQLKYLAIWPKNKCNGTTQPAVAENGRELRALGNESGQGTLELKQGAADKEKQTTKQ